VSFESERLWLERKADEASRLSEWEQYDEIMQDLSMLRYDGLMEKARSL